MKYSGICDLKMLDQTESSEGDGIVLKKRERSPLNSDFYRYSGIQSRNPSSTAIGRTIRGRSGFAKQKLSICLRRKFLLRR